MSLPVLPEPGASREDVLNQVISSIAMEELGLSHILNAEGEKLQYVLGTLTGVTGLSPTVEQLLLINESVQQTINSAMQKEVFLNNKLTAALNTPSLTGPTGPTAPCIL